MKSIEDKWKLLPKGEISKYDYIDIKNVNESIKWISTIWLEDHLEDENLIIIDSQPHFMDYIENHIPGSIYMSEKLFRSYDNNRPCVHNPEKSMELILRRYGINNDIPIVIYTGKGSHGDMGNGLVQTIVAYSLIRYGVKNIFILDGGFDKWKKENKKMTKVFPIVKESYFSVESKVNILTIDMIELKEIKDGDDVILLDARPSSAYEGQAEWIKPGHIPGAVNLSWSKLMNKDNNCLLKPMEELVEIFENVGATKDKNVICSCGTSREATMEFILLKYYLKYPRVKIYEGSFTEWSSCPHPENPTVTGSNPYFNNVKREMDINEHGRESSTRNEEEKRQEEKEEEREKIRKERKNTIVVKEQTRINFKCPSCLSDLEFPIQILDKDSISCPFCNKQFQIIRDDSS